MGNSSSTLPELHIISSPGLGHAVFHPLTYTLFRVNERTSSVLRDLKSGEPIEAVAKKRELPRGKIEALVAQVNQHVGEASLVQEPEESQGYLSKLVLNVSHDCNMRCRYCYADEGSYGQVSGLMTPTVARQAIDRVFERYQVPFVMFFGGEPTLNPDAIQAACDRLLELHDSGAISHLPKWGMVTNGLVLTPRVQEIIKQYDLIVTVSLDGPPEINDRLRIARNGKGSYSSVARNIRRIQEITDGRQPSKIEVTYTAAHQEAGFKMSDLAGYLEQEFDINDIHFAPVAVEPGHPLCWRPSANGQEADTLRENAVQLVESWLTENPSRMSSFFESLPMIVTHFGSRYLCGAGLTILAVAADGGLYPCYVLLEDEFLMGNVADAHLFESERFQAVQQRFRENAKSSLAQCSECWARLFCHVCFLETYTENQMIDQIPEHICARNKISAEAALLALSRIQAKPDSWKLLCKNVGKTADESGRI